MHDHGFNNVSTYGNLRRLMLEGRIPADDWELRFYDLALKISGAVQAARWTQIAPDLGYVYSFNGPHSLFSDTIRSMRSLVVAHQLGHRLMGEGDEPIDLLRRALQHAAATARWNVYYGIGRDSFDIRGRVVHESIFNLNNRAYRCPSTQQGYSPFTTWTRGQAWILCGYAEQLEFLHTQSEAALAPYGGKRELLLALEEVASAVASFWLEHTPTDGIPYWDTGAPNLHKLGDWASRPSDPFNQYEPVDSSAAAIAAQGLLRYGNYTSTARAVKAKATSMPARRPHHRPPSFRGTLPLDQCHSPGSDSPLHLSPAQRVGPQASRPENSERRIVHVGRLSRPRAGAHDPTRSESPAVLHVFLGDGPSVLAPIPHGASSSHPQMACN